MTRIPVIVRRIAYPFVFPFVALWYLGTLRVTHSTNAGWTASTRGQGCQRSTWWAAVAYTLRPRVLRFWIRSFTDDVLMLGQG